jgi:hypothetical protein
MPRSVAVSSTRCSACPARSQSGRLLDGVHSIRFGSAYSSMVWLAGS